jgi:hypothetical protein
MAQNATTVTNPNPTPPTNLSSTGSTLPNPATFASGIYGTDLHYPPNPSSSPIYYDDGVANTYPVISQNEGGGVNGTTNPSPVGTLTSFATNHAAVATGGTSVAAEGAGTEVLVTLSVPNPSPAGQLKMVSCGPVLTPGVLPQPNQLAGSSLNPTTNPALASISPTTLASASSGTQVITCTGTNFTRGCYVWVDNQQRDTTFSSATTITATVNKKPSAGIWLVDVKLGGVAVPTTQTFTWT